MLGRYGLRDDQWGRIKDLLPGREGTVGVTAKIGVANKRLKAAWDNNYLAKVLRSLRTRNHLSINVEMFVFLRTRIKQIFSGYNLPYTPLFFVYKGYLGLFQITR